MARKKQSKTSAETRCCCKKHAVCTRLPTKKNVRKKVARKKVARKKASKAKTSEKRMRKSIPKNSGPITLEEKVGIKNVLGLVECLDTLLTSDSEIVIDAEAVQSVDIAALQVLIAFANSPRAQANGIKWKCGDGMLRQMAVLADVERHLLFDSGAEVVEDDGLCPVF